MPEFHFNINKKSSDTTRSKGKGASPHSVDSAIVRRLRRRFLTTSMSALLIIVVLMVAVINIANYSQISISAFETLELLASNSGVFPDSSPSSDAPDDAPSGDAPDDNVPSDEASSESSLSDASSSDSEPADNVPGDNAPPDSDSTPPELDNEPSPPSDREAPGDPGSGPASENTDSSSDSDSDSTSDEEVRSAPGEDTALVSDENSDSVSEGSTAAASGEGSDSNSEEASVSDKGSDSAPKEDSTSVTSVENTAAASDEDAAVSDEDATASGESESAGAVSAESAAAAVDDDDDASSDEDAASSDEDVNSASDENGDSESTSGPSSASGPGSGRSDPGDPGSGSGGKSPSRRNEHRSFPEIDINEARRLEAPYETRYFSVRLDADGNVLSTDTAHIAAVTEEVAQEYALTVYYNGSTRGSATSYRYLAVTEEDGNILVLFVDCSSSLAEAQQLMWYSLGVGAVALVLMFLLVWLFSGRSVAPVVESLEKQKRFISDAGHELKTPITIISANVDVLEMLGEQNEWTQSIRSQTVRMTDLINNMLTLSRMEEDSLPVVFTDVDFSALVQECAASFHVVAQAGGLDYSIAIREKLHVNGDPASLRQLCTILLDNAMKYSSDHGSVYLSLHREKKDSQRMSEGIRKGRSAGSVVLEVSNTCDAIPEGNLDRLFDRFYRADSSRTRESRATWHVAPSAAQTEENASSGEASGAESGNAPTSRRSSGGFGIGLSVAKAVVSAHGGTIRAHIDGDRLIRFEVILPEQIPETMPAAESPAEQTAP